MLQAALYVVLSFLVALLGIGKRGGFLFHLVTSLALTPVAGIVVVLVAPEKSASGNAKGGKDARS